MSTRSRIGIQWPDGPIESIYCHFDGYPEGVGAQLAGCWNDEEKILALIALGNISVLGADLNSTEAYARDRGEELDMAQHAGLDEYLAYAKESWADYTYLYIDGSWKVYTDGEWSPLSTVLALVK